MREGSDLDDIVTGICDDPNNSNAFYITGATFGSIGTSMSDAEFPDKTLYAFISKIDADSLESVWTLQWGAIRTNSDLAGAVYALDCAVFDDIVYVGGVVKDGGSIVHGGEVRPSHGGDDIWLAQITSDGTTVNWLNQVGSLGDDQMAPYQGVIASSAGHAIVYGDTTGPLFRVREVSDLHDLIAMTFDTNGSYGLPIRATLSPTISPTDYPTLLEPTPTVPVARAPIPVAAQPIAFIPADDSNTKDGDRSNGGAAATAADDSSKMSPAATAALVIFLLILFAIIVWCFCYRRRRRGRSSSNSTKRDNMTGFDFEDKAKRDGIFASTNGDSTNSWSSTQQRGGLGGLLYTDDPGLGEPNLNGGTGYSDTPKTTGYSDLKNNGKEVI
jgi:hypothetical protein